MDLYLKDILDYSDVDTQSFYSKSDNENKSQDYYPQSQSFSYFENKVTSRPILKTKPSYQTKSLPLPSKDKSEYREIFNKDFFADHNKLKRQQFLKLYNITQTMEIQSRYYTFIKSNKTSIKFFDWFEKYDSLGQSRINPKTSNKPISKTETDTLNSKLTLENKYNSEVIKKGNECSYINKKISIYLEKDKRVIEYLCPCLQKDKNPQLKNFSSKIEDMTNQDSKIPGREM